MKAALGRYFQAHCFVHIFVQEMREYILNAHMPVPL